MLSRNFCHVASSARFSSSGRFLTSKYLSMKILRLEKNNTSPF